jgi:hypothetical protein
VATTPEGNVMAKIKLVKIGLPSVGRLMALVGGVIGTLDAMYHYIALSSTGVFGISGVAYALGHLIGSVFVEILIGLVGGYVLGVVIATLFNLANDCTGGIDLILGEEKEPELEPFALPHTMPSVPILKARR